MAVIKKNVVRKLVTAKVAAKASTGISTFTVSIPSNSKLARAFAAMCAGFSDSDYNEVHAMFEDLAGKFNVVPKKRADLKVISKAANRPTDSDADDSDIDSDADDSDIDSDADDSDIDSDADDSDIDSDADDSDIDSDADDSDDTLDFSDMDIKELKAWIVSECGYNSDKFDFSPDMLGSSYAAKYNKAENAVERAKVLRGVCNNIAALQEAWADRKLDRVIQLADKVGADTNLGRGNRSEELKIRTHAARAAAAGYKPKE